VQKRINTRLFAINGGKLENPAPGCVVDHTITRRFLFDFFLVPQNVRQGTVTPTHYIVVHDSSDYSPDIIQRLSYKLCFLYYNCPGLCAFRLVVNMPTNWHIWLENPLSANRQKVYLIGFTICKGKCDLSHQVNLF